MKVSRNGLLRTLCLATAAWLTTTSGAHAQSVTSSVGLDGAQESPPVATTATASATVTLDPTTLEISVSGTYSGLSSTQTLAHIHEGAFGVPGGILVTLSGTGGTSGTFSGTGVLTPAQRTTMLAGGLYLNVHSTNHPSGEIRGQIVNLAGSAQLPTDPQLSDNGGNPIRGPRIGNATETFNVALDCSNAGAPGTYSIQIRAGALTPPFATQFGFLWQNGPRLFTCSGAHSQNVVSCFGAGGQQLPNDPTLVGLSYSVQGFCSNPSAPPGRISTALIQIIEQ